MEKYINETKNYFTEEPNKKDLMSRKHKKVCTALHYVNTYLFYLLQLLDMFLFLLFFSWNSCRHCKICITIKSLYNNCRIIKNNKSIINQKQKNHEKISLLAKTNNSIKS